MSHLGSPIFAKELLSEDGSFAASSNNCNDNNDNDRVIHDHVSDNSELQFYCESVVKVNLKGLHHHHHRRRSSTYYHPGNKSRKSSTTGATSKSDADDSDDGDSTAKHNKDNDDDDDDSFLKHYRIPKKRVQTEDEAALGIDPNEGPPVLDALYYPPTEMLASLLPTHAIPHVRETLGDDGLEPDEFVDFMFDLLSTEYPILLSSSDGKFEQECRKQLYALFREVDANDNGDVSWEELSTHMLVNVRTSGGPTLEAERDHGFDPPPPGRKFQVFHLSTQTMHAIRFLRGGVPPCTFSPAWGCHIVAQETGMEFGVPAQVELAAYKLSSARAPTQPITVPVNLLTQADRAMRQQKLDLIGRSTLPFRLCGLEPLDGNAEPIGMHLRRPWLAATTSDDRLLYIELADDPLTLMTNDGVGQLRVVRSQYLPGKHMILRWNPVSKFLAVADTRGRVKIIDPTDTLSGLPKQLLSFHGGGRTDDGGLGTVSDLATMPELASCDKLIVAGTDNIRVFDTARDGEVLHTLGDRVFATKLAYSSEMQLVAACVAGGDPNIHLLTPHSSGRSSLVRTLHDPTTTTGVIRGYPKSVSALAGTPYIVSYDTAGMIRLWDLRTSLPVCCFRSTGEDASYFVDSSEESLPLCTTRSVAVDPRSLEISTVSRTVEGSRTDLFRMKLCDARDPMDAHDADILNLCFVPDMRQLVSIATDDTVHFWDGRNMALRRRIKEFVNDEGETAVVPGRSKRPVTACATELPNGRRIYIGLATGEVFLYSSVTRCEIAQFPSHDGQVVQIVISLAERVVTGGADGVIHVSSTNEELDYRNYATIRLDSAVVQIHANPIAQLIFALDATCKIYEVDADPEGAYVVLSASRAVHAASATGSASLFQAELEAKKAAAAAAAAASAGAAAGIAAAARPGSATARGDNKNSINHIIQTPKTPSLSRPGTAATGGAWAPAASSSPSARNTNNNNNNNDNKNNIDVDDVDENEKNEEDDDDLSNHNNNNNKTEQKTKNNNNNNNNRRKKKGMDAAALEAEYLNPTQFEGTCCLLCRPRAAAVVADARGYLSVIPTRPTPRHGEYYMCRWRSYTAGGTENLRGATLSVPTALIYTEGDGDEDDGNGAEVQDKDEDEDEDDENEEEEEEEGQFNSAKRRDMLIEIDEEAEKEREEKKRAKEKKNQAREEQRLAREEKQVRMERKMRRRAECFAAAANSTLSSSIAAAGSGSGENGGNNNNNTNNISNIFELYVGDDQGTVSVWCMRATFSTGKIGKAVSMFAIEPGSIPAPSHTDPPVIQDEFAARPRLLRHFPATEDGLPVSAMALIRSRNLLVVAARTKIRLLRLEGDSVGIVAQGRCVNFETFGGGLLSLRGEESSSSSSGGDEDGEEENEVAESHLDRDGGARSRRRSSFAPAGSSSFTTPSAISPPKTQRQNRRGSTSSSTHNNNNSNNNNNNNNKDSGRQQQHSLTRTRSLFSSFAQAQLRQQEKTAPTKEELTKREFEDVLGAAGKVHRWVAVLKGVWDGVVARHAMYVTSGCGELDLSEAKASEAAGARVTVAPTRTPQTSPMRADQFKKNTHGIRLLAEKDTATLRRVAPRKIGAAGSGGSSVGNASSANNINANSNTKRSVSPSSGSPASTAAAAAAAVGVKHGSGITSPLLPAGLSRRARRNRNKNDPTGGCSSASSTNNSDSDAEVLNETVRGGGGGGGGREGGDAEMASSPPAAAIPVPVGRKFALMAAAQQPQQQQQQQQQSPRPLPLSPFKLCNPLQHHHQQQSNSFALADATRVESGSFVADANENSGLLDNSFVSSSDGNQQQQQGASSTSTHPLALHSSASKLLLTSPKQQQPQRQQSPQSDNDKEVAAVNAFGSAGRSRSSALFLKGAASASPTTVGNSRSSSGPNALARQATYTAFDSLSHPFDDDSNDAFSTMLRRVSEALYNEFERDKLCNSTSGGNGMVKLQQQHQQHQSEQLASASSGGAPMLLPVALASPLASPIAPALRMASPGGAVSSSSRHLLSKLKQQQQQQQQPASASSQQLHMMKSPSNSSGFLDFALEASRKMALPSTTHAIMYRRPLLYPLAKPRDATISAVVNGATNFSSAGGWVDRLEATVAERGMSNPQLPQRDVVQQIRAFAKLAAVGRRLRWTVPLTTVIEVEEGNAARLAAALHNYRLEQEERRDAGRRKRRSGGAVAAAAAAVVVTSTSSTAQRRQQSPSSARARSAGANNPSLSSSARKRRSHGATSANNVSGISSAAHLPSTSFSFSSASAPAAAVGSVASALRRSAQRRRDGGGIASLAHGAPIPVYLDMSGNRCLAPPSAAAAALDARAAQMSSAPSSSLQQQQQQQQQQRHHVSRPGGEVSSFSLTPAPSASATEGERGGLSSILQRHIDLSRRRKQRIGHRRDHNNNSNNIDDDDDDDVDDDVVVREDDETKCRAAASLVMPDTYTRALLAERDALVAAEQLRRKAAAEQQRRDLSLSKCYLRPSAAGAVVSSSGSETGGAGSTMMMTAMTPSAVLAKRRAGILKSELAVSDSVVVSVDGRDSNTSTTKGGNATIIARKKHRTEDEEAQALLDRLKRPQHQHPLPAAASDTKWKVEGGGGGACVGVASPSQRSHRPNNSCDDDNSLELYRSCLGHSVPPGGAPNAPRELFNVPTSLEANHHQKGTNDHHGGSGGGWHASAGKHISLRVPRSKK